jgi:formylglycine-generating enzyme required for sulfatase activity
MYFDLDSGNVYVNDERAGQEGVEAPADAPLLYDASVGRIHLIDDAYTVDDGFEHHPVVGVTWYGAVKFCNWLTIRDGIPAELRAYREAPSSDPGGWRPVTATDWENGNFTDDERDELIRRTVGYRLPMDGGDGSNPGPYNEWYKAAAWDPMAGKIGENHTYGFGREDIQEQDANYFDSGDTEQEGTTPVGFFNGKNGLSGDPTVCPSDSPHQTLTAGSDNTYGLYDACGNAAEWTQDFGDLPAERPTGTSAATVPLLRATRGGSWRDPQDSPLLKTDGRGSLPADGPETHVGFRVVRGTGAVATVTVTDHLSDVSYERYFILDVRRPLLIEPVSGLERSGVYGDIFSGYLRTYTLANYSALQMQWEVTADASWIEVMEAESGGSEGTIAGVTDGNVQSIGIEVELNALADQLGPGTHEGIIQFRNVTTGLSQTRGVTLTIEQPISVTPCGPQPHEFSAFWEGPFEILGPCTYEVASDVSFDLNYEVGVDQPWITVEPLEPEGGLSGPLPGGAVLSFDVVPNEAGNALDVGEYEAAVRFAFADPGNGHLSSLIEQTVTLVVMDPIVIDPPAEPCVTLDPDAPQASQAFTLTNNASTSIDVSLGVDVDWLDLDAIELEIAPGQQGELTASLNDQVFSLPDGEYFAAITFDDNRTGDQQCRTVMVTIDENLFVEPFEGFFTTGVPGGPIGPLFKVYTLTNAGSGGPIDWEVAVETDDAADWVTLSGADPAANIEDGESVTVLVAIDADQTHGMDEGVYSAVVQFTDVTHGSEAVSRPVTLTIVAPEFSLAEAQVPSAAQQPGGPVYPYMMGAFPTTNAQFAAFLNDCLANLENERGQYMFFDTITGDVYVNYAMVGAVGDDPGPRNTLMFSPGVAGQIVYGPDQPQADIASPPCGRRHTASLGLQSARRSAQAKARGSPRGGRYQVIAGPVDYSQHPVAGVSWYGALKFCNWLTLDQGMLPGQRCYAEATDAGDAKGWHPVTISTSDWEVRDLTDSERLELVSNYRGYRLPMDDGANNPQPAVDLPDAYNEWYKAAAWDPDDGVNHLYGFGRDVLGGADANFRCSGDPLEDPSDCTVGATTPVGLFDGTVYNHDGRPDEDQVPDDGDFMTTANENSFGLFDLTGNVDQWIQGYWAPPGVLDRRTLRGGGWNDPMSAASLQTNARPLWTFPGATHGEIGFRVVKALASPTGDSDRDGDVDRDDFAELAARMTGPSGGVLPEWTIFDFDSDGDVDLSDFAAFQTLFGV